MSAAPQDPLGSPTTLAAYRRRSENPFAARLLLGANLRWLREEQGISMKEASEHIRGSVSKISRLENAESSPSDRDVFDLLERYKVTDPQQVEELSKLLGDAQTLRTWPYADAAPGWFRRLIGLEHVAVRIETFEPVSVPGLLQTREYAWGILRAAPKSREDTSAQQRVDLRRERQRLLEEPDPPEMLALLDESVLWRPYGGPEAMHAQVRHLREMAEQSGSPVRVIPLKNSVGISPTPSMTSLTLPTQHEMVYLEHVSGATYLDKKSDVQPYKLQMMGLMSVAAGRRESIRLLDEAIARYR
ncbi:helix-turn-helix domain-containing protein [Streptomyces sp. NPDC054796]